MSKVNAHYVHGPKGNRSILSLYPKESSATNQNLYIKLPRFKLYDVMKSNLKFLTMYRHDQKYAKALDMSMLYPGNEKTECSSIWTSKTGSNCPNSAGNIRTHFSLVLLIVMMTLFTTLANRIY